ncbi:fimbrial protein [Kalamiella sp. sgz302252]|uniref:fimbrial protein n=1 Tax=Pantoea sp. sgz302252 TaxID=3341827 RepID=UPI0036D39C0A
MKKLLIAAAVMAAFAGGSAQAASTGVIEFNGLLTESTCNVDSVNGTAGADGEVTLPPLDISTLPAQDSTAGDTAFTIELSGCTNASTVAAYFQADTQVNTNGRLTNTTTNGANVTLQLLDYADAADSNNNAITIGSDAQSNSTEFVDATSGVATLKYGVRYFAENGAATAGTVTSSVVYALMYK